MSETRGFRRALGWLAASLLAAMLPGVARAQSGRIGGTVTDTAGTPLAGVQIGVVGTSRSTASDARGRFGLADVAPGTYELRVQRIGMKARSVAGVAVRAGEEARIDVALEPTAVALGGVVVSASRRVEKITDAPATVTRLDVDQLARSAATITSALKEVKGIDLVQVGMTAVAINARGFNSSFNNRMLMLEDGRISVLPESGLPLGGFTTLPKVDLASIEVLVGPGSALYGADASNGVITIQSKDPKQFPGTTVEVTGGNRQFQDYQLRHAGVTSRGRLGYKLAGEYMSANDWQNQLHYALGTARVPEIGPGGKVDWRTSALRGEGALVWYQGDGRFEVTGGASRNDGVGQTNVGRNQFTNWIVRNAQAKWVSPHWYLNGYALQSKSGESYAINRYSTNRVAFPRAIPDDSVRLASDWPSDGRLFAGEIQNNFSIAALNRTRVVWGGQLRRDQVSSNREWPDDRVTGEDVAFNQRGVYGQLETPLTAKLRAVVAARYDKHDDYDPQLSPKAGLLYSPVEDQTLRVTFNRAFKSPTILQTHFNIADFVALPAGLGGFGVFGNSRGFTVKNAAGATLATYQPVQPEENTTWELGYKAILGQRLFVDAALYRSQYDHFLSPLVTINTHLTGVSAYDADGQRITSRNGPQSVLTYLNLGKARLSGSDLGLRWYLDPRWTASGTLSLVKLDRVEKKPTDPPAVIEATALNTTPTKWNVGMDYASPASKIVGGFNVRHVTGYNFRSGINVGTIPTFETLDLSLGRKIPSLGAQLNVSLQNIVSCRSGHYEGSSATAPPGTLVRHRRCDIGLRHLEMINMPAIGTMVFVGLRYER